MAAFAQATNHHAIQMVMAMWQAFKNDVFTVAGGKASQSVLSIEDTLQGHFLVHGQLHRFFLQIS